MNDPSIPPVPVAPPKLAEYLVARIQDRIDRERLPPGTRLGTEPELMAQYGISRDTLRHAIRQLERHGVATMRRGGGGGGGGLIVAAAASQTAVHAITAYLEFSDISWSEISEARSLIDVEAAALASRRIDATGIAHLRSLSAGLDRGARNVRDIARRHLALPDAIAEISGNPVLRLFSDALSDWTFDVLPSDLGTPEARERETRRVNESLQRLVEAIAAGNEQAARTAAEDFSARSLKAARLLETRRRLTPVEDWLKSEGAAGTKLAQRLALALARDVAARQWPAERFGAEAELLARFGVSRTTWREAIRMLEMHGIARPQRGRGGGLMIGRPDPAYTIASARRYLRRARLAPADYLSMRRTLEAGAIRHALARASDDEIGRLEQLARRLAQADDDAVTALAIDWHAQLSALSHNRALSLLLRILFALTEEAGMSLPADVAQTLRTRHARLTRALAARDEKRALAVADEHVQWLNQVLELGLGTLSA